MYLLSVYMTANSLLLVGKLHIYYNAVDNCNNGTFQTHWEPIASKTQAKKEAAIM